MTDTQFRFGSDEEENRKELQKRLSDYINKNQLLPNPMWKTPKDLYKFVLNGRINIGENYAEDPQGTIEFVEFMKNLYEEDTYKQIEEPRELKVDAFALVESLKCGIALDIMKTYIEDI